MFAVRLIVLWLFAFLATVTYADAYTVSTERTETTLLSEVKAIHAGQKFWVVLHIKLQPGWHTYWKNPGDSGIAPAFTWTLPNGFSASEIQYLAPDREKVGPLVNYAYNDNAYYLVTITPPSILRENTTSILALKARWLVCKDVCIPESGSLSLALSATAQSSPERSTDAMLVADLVRRLPVPLSEPVGFNAQDGAVHFSLKNPAIPYGRVKSAEFFPLAEGFITNAAEESVNITPNAIAFNIKQAEGKLSDTTSGVISLFLKNGERKDYDVRLQAGAGAADADAKPRAALGSKAYGGLLGEMLFAFLGGLILNLMPCVFPILSLKALAVAKKSSEHPDAVRAQGIAYTVGAILSFLTLAAILVIIRAGGQVIGWGYQMQSPVFVSFLAILMFLVGLNLSGYFELPVLLGNVGVGGGEQGSKRATFASFTTGVLAVMVATPCTAPFMAPAIGFALTGTIPVIFGVFTSLGFGFGFPFLLISLFPKMVKALPKPGAWMNIFKQFLAFPMFLTVVWLLWVLTREAGADAGSITLISLVVVTFAIWLWQRESSVARFVGLLVAVAGLAFTTAVLHTMQPMPMQAQARKHAVEFSEKALDELRKEGKPVLVDATADWCITCKVNETVALSSEKVIQALDDKHVTYMVANWTHGEMEITHYLESFGRDGVPLYVYYPPGGGAPVVLPQVLTESIVINTIQ